MRVDLAKVSIKDLDTHREAQGHFVVTRLVNGKRATLFEFQLGAGVRKDSTADDVEAALRHELSFLVRDLNYAVNG